VEYVYLDSSTSLLHVTFVLYRVLRLSGVHVVKNNILFYRACIVLRMYIVHQPRLYHGRVKSKTLIFVYLFTILRPAQEFFTYMETSPLPGRAAKFKPILSTQGSGPRFIKEFTTKTKK
jgi:hypothetical protein